MGLFPREPARESGNGYPDPLRGCSRWRDEAGQLAEADLQDDDAVLQLVRTCPRSRSLPGT